MYFLCGKDFKVTIYPCNLEEAENSGRSKSLIDLNSQILYIY